MTVRSGLSLRFQVAVYKHLVELDLNNRKLLCFYSRTLLTRTLKGNEKQFELLNLRGIRVIGVIFSEIVIKGKEI